MKASRNLMFVVVLAVLVFIGAGVSVRSRAAGFDSATLDVAADRSSAAETARLETLSENSNAARAESFAVAVARSSAAEAARWASLREANAGRALGAASATLATTLPAAALTHSERGLAADSARLTAAGNAYAAGVLAAENRTWSAAELASAERGRSADSARLSAAGAAFLARSLGNK